MSWSLKIELVESDYPTGTTTTTRSVSMTGRTDDLVDILLTNIGDLLP